MKPELRYARFYKAMKLETGFRRYFKYKNSRYGDNISPQLNFEDFPAETESIAVIIENTDKGRKDSFTNWLVWNIPPSNNLEAGTPKKQELENGIKQGENSAGGIGYAGPKPPRGARHTYLIKVFALETELGISSGSTKTQLEQAMEGKILDKAEENTSYKRDFDDSTTEL